MSTLNICYEHNYYHAGGSVMSESRIPEILGKADASDEWTNTSLANANFINISAYNSFVDPSCIFLVGRIGSGKTTLLNKLKYSIEQKKVPEYSSTVMINTCDYIAQLGSSLRLSEVSGLSYTEIEYHARKEWEKTINIIAMVKLYSDYYTDYPNDFKKIKAYLEENDYIPKKYGATILEKICSDLRNINNTHLQDTVTVINLLSHLVSPNYRDAVEELQAALDKFGKILILIDSIEKYEFNDNIILAILNALANLCIEHTRNNLNIPIKMAAPSELIPQLMSINPEKISSKTVYIRWSHNDLKSFIAVRVYRYKNNIPADQNVNLEAALDYFNSYYEEYCYTRCEFKFPTFSYCLSYTQKEPRQLLSIFNAWLFLEETRKNRNRMHLVDDAITHDELQRIKGALSIYSSIHPKMFEMFKRTFNNRKYCFSEQQFDEWLNSCSNIRGNVDAYDLKKYFISSGLVGTMIEMHNVNPDDKQLRPGRPVRIKEVIFEYQYKECLPFNSDTKFCLHPMVFNALNIEVDKNTFVYPKPLESDSEFIPWRNNNS